VKVTNTTGVDLYVAAAGVTVADGATLDTDELTAAALLAQGWGKPGRKAATEPADTAAPEEDK
jgi:hypothetical protein